MSVTKIKISGVFILDEIKWFTKIFNITHILKYILAIIKLKSKNIEYQ